MDMTFNHQRTDVRGGFTGLVTGYKHMKSVPLYPLSDSRGLGFAVLRKQAASDNIPGQSRLRVELILVHLEWCERTFNSTTTKFDGPVLGALEEEIVLDGPINNTTDSENAREYISTSSGRHYYISQGTDWMLGNILANHLRQYITRSRISYQSPTDSTYIQHGFLSWHERYLGHYLSVTDLDKVASNVASAVSAFISSSADMVGGNLNASIISGKALITETYIKVRWQWLILPILETVLTAGLLIITIIVDRRSGYPLLKSSSLGLLFYGLRRSNSTVDVEQAVGTTNTGRKCTQLENIAENLVVQFKADTNGTLGLYHNREA